MNTPNPAPVPPAQPTDLDKMVEAIANEAVNIAVTAYQKPRFTHADAVADVSAILLRHLQPLAEQEQALANLRTELEICTRQRDYWQEDRQKILAEINGLKSIADERDELRNRLEVSNGLQTNFSRQLTAAQEELARVKRERDRYLDGLHELAEETDLRNIRGTIQHIIKS